LQEIVPCITDTISFEEAEAFANSVIDRFCNPFIEHKWLSISVNYTAKIKMRCVPLILDYYEKKDRLPTYMSAGFAAYILFTKPVEFIDGSYYGKLHGSKYKIDDDSAVLFYDLWQHLPADKIVHTILSDELLWETDLTKIPGFTLSVQYFLQQFNCAELKYVIKGLS
jgi:tagaturonate reductase